MTLLELANKVGNTTKIYTKTDINDKFVLLGSAADIRESDNAQEVVIFSASAGRLNVRVKDTVVA